MQRSTRPPQGGTSVTYIEDDTKLIFDSIGGEVLAIWSCNVISLNNETGLISGRLTAKHNHVVFARVILPDLARLSGVVDKLLAAKEITGAP